MLDYTFVFCKATKTPVAIYCGEEVQENEDVITLVGELAEKFTLIGGLVQSSYFDELSKALLDVEEVTLV
jgi:isoaspartyl peptidase/L-asparaginase-like protein (Ntn-hydrolase superfamily)